MYTHDYLLTALLLYIIVSQETGMDYPIISTVISNDLLQIHFSMVA